MQQREIIAMMDARKVQGISSTDGVSQLAEKFPYCSTFQVLKAIGLKEQDSLDFKTQLNRAAIAIQDRSKLYEYIVKENLLDRIEASSVDQETSETVKEVAPTLRGEIDDENESESERVEKDVQEAHFKLETIEDQIMREAISHLSEIESDMRLSELAAQPDDEIEIADKAEMTGAIDEPLSFGAWLLQKDSPHRRTPQSKGETPPVERQIIDKFIQESPQISPVKTAFFSPSQMGKMSLVEDESFVTETLAKIYERQGDFKKAANAYKYLKLKFPEKSTYFADLQKKAEDQLK